MFVLVSYPQNQVDWKKRKISQQMSVFLFVDATRSFSHFQPEDASAGAGAGVLPMNTFLE